MNPIPFAQRALADALEPRRMLAVAPLLSFDAQDISTSGSIPPDCHAAVGTTMVLTIVNGQVELRDKTNGALVDNETLSFFFDQGPNVTALTKVFDPRVQFDPYSNRFVAIALGKQDDPGSATDQSELYVGVSSNAAPANLNGPDWNWYEFNALQVIDGAKHWMDFPGLSVGVDGIYVAGNYFKFDNQASSNQSRMFGIRKGDLYAGVPPASVVSWLDDPSAKTGSDQGVTLRPAQMYGARPISPDGPVDCIIVHNANSNLPGDDFFNVWYLADPFATRVFRRPGAGGVNVGNVGDSSPFFRPNAPPAAEQPGSSTGLETGDSTVCDAVWQNNQLWFANVVNPANAMLFDSLDDNQATVVWYEVATLPFTNNPSNGPSLLLEGKIGGEEFGPSTHTFYPAIDIDALGNVAVGFSYSSTTQFGSAAFTYRRPTDPVFTNPAQPPLMVGTMRPAGSFAQGLATYVNTGSGTRNRWGDYSGLALDPSDNVTFWAYNQYAGFGNAWNTRVAKYGAATVVINTNDSGPGSLRDAINASNVAGGVQTIDFAIPTADPGYDGHCWTIRPTSALPAFTDPFQLSGPTDGTGPLIVVNGGLAGAGVSGITINTSNSEFRQMVVNGFSQAGVVLADTSNIVANCFIGTDCPGTAAVPNGTHGVLVLSGANANTIGGSFPADRNVISGNTQHGINLLSDSNRVFQNYIGTNASGTAAIPNSMHGVRISGSFNEVGGTPLAAFPNVISGNLAAGVRIVGSVGGDSNLVSGNIIGLNATGNAPVPNDRGVQIAEQALFNTIGYGPGPQGDFGGVGNTISGNLTYGVGVFDQGTSNTTIAGNRIGLDIFGLSPLGNGAEGVRLANASSSTLVGWRLGLNVNSARNLIAGNAQPGVLINQSNFNTVAGNTIGLSFFGDARPNAVAGVRVIDATANDIGGADTRQRNIISGNTGAGVLVEGVGTVNHVYGNYIGTSVAGTVARPNSGFGVDLQGTGGVAVGNSAATGNIISGNSAGGVRAFNSTASSIAFNRIGVAVGSTEPALGNGGPGVSVESGGNATVSDNLVRNNQGAGVVVLGTARAMISHNSIDQNTGLGIDLAGDGATPNDGGASDDVDSGPNALQNFPDIIAATLLASSLEIVGTLSSTPNTQFVIEFFVSPIGDASSHGEGRTSVGASSTLTTDPMGELAFTVVVPSGNYAAQQLSAVARNVTTSETSEFSSNELVVTALPPKVPGANFLFETAPQQLTFTFDRSVAASLAIGDITIQNLTTTNNITPTNLSYDLLTNTATFDLPTPVPDGDYEATLSSAGIEDQFNLHLDGNGDQVAGDDFVFPFFVLAGDANRDRVVNIDDLFILASNWKQLSRTFSQANFSYDVLGKVDETDLGILASNWQKRPDGTLANSAPMPVMAGITPTRPPTRPPTRTPRRVIENLDPASQPIIA